MTVIRIKLGRIDLNAFWNNTFVEEVVLPKSLKRLGGDCFYYCTNLKKVNIPDGVTHIASYAFSGCTSLTKAPTVLPATTVGQNCYNRMFAGCTSLKIPPVIKCTSMSTYYSMGANMLSMFANACEFN